MKVVPSDDSVLGINEAFAMLAVWSKDKFYIQMLPVLEEAEECFCICSAKHCISLTLLAFIMQVRTTQ